MKITIEYETDNWRTIAMKELDKTIDTIHHDVKVILDFKGNGVSK